MSRRQFSPEVREESAVPHFFQHVVAVAVDDGLEIGGGHPFGRSSFDVSNPLGAPPFSPVFGERVGATKGGPCSIYFNSESTFRVRRVTSRVADAVRNGGGQGWGTRGVSVNDDRAIIYKNALDPYKAVQGAFTKLYFDNTHSLPFLGLLRDPDALEGALMKL